ncbi:uncharacterized protein FTOL_05243 [Fusarium torulosum]|uniref:Uncharacterized protein n=1 Tax=Fusarium torulosum TaxID=33205 RepID=A0AAE8SHE9_9HYPO|nr:uncharacterized protein FTOL_05243 [Fusarium torulosum]
MVNNHSDRHDETGRPISINTSSTSSSSRYRQRGYDKSPEPAFSPTGLLGNGYDMRRQEMEARSQEAEQHAPQSPFTGGLLQSLAEFETEQRLVRTGSHRASYDSFGTRRPTRAASTSATTYRSQPSQDFARPRRTLSVASARTDSIYCAQTGVTPPPLLDMTSTLPQRQPSWRDRNTQGIRSPLGRPLLGLPENSIHQWNASQSPSLSRSQSVAVRPASDVSAALERRTSSATAPVRPTTWNEAAQSEPKRRGTLRRC